jgi:hypothetical protein
LGEGRVQNAGLDGAHLRGAASGRVFQTIQVEQAMHCVKRYFASKPGAKSEGIGAGGFCADDDLAVLKSEDVGGSIDLHEFGMESCHGAIGHERHFDFAEPGEDTAAAARFESAHACLEGEPRKTSQPPEINSSHQTLPVENANSWPPRRDNAFPARISFRPQGDRAATRRSNVLHAAVIGTVFEDVDGVSCLSVPPRPPG